MLCKVVKLDNNLHCNLSILKEVSYSGLDGCIDVSMPAQSTSPQSTMAGSTGA